MTRFIIPLLLLILQSGFIQAQDIKVRTWLDTSGIFIGDQIFYNIEITQPAGTLLGIQLQEDTLIDKIEVLATEPADTSFLADNNIKINIGQLITSFDTGRYDIPPFYAELNNKSGIERYFSDYAHLDVIRIDVALQDTTDVIFDITGPRKAPVSLMEILPWVVLALIAALIIYRVIRFFSHRKRNEEEKVKGMDMPSEPVHIAALRELDKLEKLKLWQKGEVKRHYSLLTETIRRYIDSMYMLNSMEMTSGETLASLKKTGFKNGELTELLASLFLNADLSKFAKYVPDNEYNSISIEKARRFIKETTISSDNNTEGDSGEKGGEGEDE